MCLSKVNISLCTEYVYGDICNWGTDKSLDSSVQVQNQVLKLLVSPTVLGAAGVKETCFKNPFKDYMRVSSDKMDVSTEWASSSTLWKLSSCWGAIARPCSLQYVGDAKEICVHCYAYKYMPVVGWMEADLSVYKIRWCVCCILACS